MIKLTGTNIPKKINPKTIGLITLPSNSPNLIQSLFKGNSKFAFSNVATKKERPREENIIKIKKLFTKIK